MSNSLSGIELFQFPAPSTESRKFQVYEMRGKDNSAVSSMPHIVDKPHRHDFFEVAFFENGGGTHQIDFIRYNIQSNSIHFISPGRVHLITRERWCSGKLIIFNSEFYNLIFQSGNTLNDLPFFQTYELNPIIQLSNHQGSFFRMIFDYIGRIQASNHPDDTSILGSYLNILLMEANKIFSKNVLQTRNNSTSHKMVCNFQRLIEKEFREKTQVCDYADILAITPVHLNNTVKKVTGKSASNLLKERRLLEAKRLLSFTDKTVKEIAFHLNFEDPSHFNRFFKQHSFITPNAFRLQGRRN